MDSEYAMEIGPDKNIVIAVDLDGTLTPSDTLHESIVAVVADKPFSLFMLPFWLAKGKAALKEIVADRAGLDITTLTYNQKLIDWLKDQRVIGKKIVLCTASNNRIAHNVAEHLQIFDEVISSDSTTNVKGSCKRKALDERYGIKGYDYAGNSSADIEVWAGARRAILVNTSKAVNEKAGQVASIAKVFPSNSINLSQWLRVFRVHQWLKNLLLFVPLLAAHQIGDIEALASLIFAFISFSLSASAVYITNDLVDLDSDRRHPRKCHRPFAAATVPIAIGLILVPLLTIASLSFGLIVSTTFTVWLVIYMALSIGYSLYLKRYVLIDCLLLAALYTLRIIAGAAAATITLSFWLLAFSLFIFLSLAFLKRYGELQMHAEIGNNQAHGRGYVVGDAPLIQIFGISAGYLAVLVLALYLNGETVSVMYAQPVIIWFAVPLILFWLSWVWMKAHRGEMQDDPIVFAIKDKASLVVALLIVVLYLLATK